MEEWKDAHRLVELEIKSGDFDRVDSDRKIECCAILSSSGAVCMRL